MKQQPEYQLQVAVCDYLRAQYPNVFFLSDTVASVKLTISQGARNKKIQCQEFKCPDLMIFEPRHGLHGLFIELKSESPYKQNGAIKASQNDHLQKQLDTLSALYQKGYSASFQWDIDEIKSLIDWYLKV